jgi:tetratricopeptide (TPR) repeat protein
MYRPYLFLTAALILTTVPLIQPATVLSQSQEVNVPDYFLRALRKDEGGDYQGALVDYNQAIKINPKNAEAYHDRAILKYNKLNDIRGALADYNQVLTLNCLPTTIEPF